MFNVGGMELLVIGLVALVVLGPDKLPGAIRQIGQVTGELRRISRGFQTELRGALNEVEGSSTAVRKADAAAPRRDTPDPGAAQAAAEAELAALEGPSGEPPTAGTNGARGSSVDDGPADPTS